MRADPNLSSQISTPCHLSGRRAVVPPSPLHSTCHIRIHKHASTRVQRCTQPSESPAGKQRNLSVGICCFTGSTQHPTDNGGNRGSRSRSRYHMDTSSGNPNSTTAAAPEATQPAAGAQAAGVSGWRRPYTPGPLTEAEFKQYWDQGHVIKQGLLTQDDLNPCYAAIER